MLNPSARGRLLAATQARGIGVLVMFAVRRALSDPEVCRALVADLVAKGAVAPPPSPMATIPLASSSIRTAPRRWSMPLIASPAMNRGVMWSSPALAASTTSMRTCAQSRRGPSRGRPQPAASDVRHRGFGQRQLKRTGTVTRDL